MPGHLSQCGLTVSPRTTEDRFCLVQYRMLAARRALLHHTLLSATRRVPHAPQRCRPMLLRQERPLLGGTCVTPLVGRGQASRNRWTSTWTVCFGGLAVASAAGRRFCSIACVVFSPCTFVSGYVCLPSYCLISLSWSPMLVLWLLESPSLSFPHSFGKSTERSV